MITKRLTAANIFNYLRGGIRGKYGEENFRGKAIVILGMHEWGQELLLRLCLEEVTLYFEDPSVRNYYIAHTICGEVTPYAGEEVDIILDFVQFIISIAKTSRQLEEVGKDPYTQGIHDFYL